MNIRSRIDRLEKQIPKPEVPQWPDFDVDPSGMDHDDFLRNFFRRVRDHADDPRATEEQQCDWREVAAEIDAWLAAKGTTA